MRWRISIGLLGSFTTSIKLHLLCQDSTLEIKTCIVQRDLCNWDVDTTFNTVLSLNTSTGVNNIGLSYHRSLLKRVVNFYFKSFLSFSSSFNREMQLTLMSMWIHRIKGCIVSLHHSNFSNFSIVCWSLTDLLKRLIQTMNKELLSGKQVSQSPWRNTL